MDILAELTRIREGSGAFHEKARRFVQTLQEAGATDIILVTCDVCEEDLHPEYPAKLASLCQELDPEAQMEEIIRRMDEQTPKIAFVRVQAETELEYLTFCFFCDSTMCGNTVEYLDNPNWDDLQKEWALRYLVLHPEWNARGIMMSGSTRYRVNFDLLVPAGQMEPQFIDDEFEGRPVQVTFTPEDDALLRLNPEMRKLYEPIERCCGDQRLQHAEAAAPQPSFYSGNQKNLCEGCLMISYYR